ncbi:MAG TPA: hypothetical protein VHR15_13655 [Ktedonobacterales bacterium]|jgi:hypothetical protein|nr:hypothetical protein [Ktedonobacterales bacterium]
MNEDTVPQGDTPSELSTPVPWARRRIALLLLGGLILTFMLWTVLLIFLFDPGILAHLPGLHGTLLLLLFAAIPLSLALAGTASDQFSVPKGWLERSFYLAALLLFEVFIIAIAINATDNRLPSEYKNAIGGIAFCCGSLSLMALVWFLELSSANPFMPHDGFYTIVLLRKGPAPRGLSEMLGHGIPLLVATALLAVPCALAIFLVVIDWRNISWLVFSYISGILSIVGAVILLFIAGVRAWRRGSKSA